MSLYTTSKRKAHQRAILKALENLNEEILTDPGLQAIQANNMKANSLN